MPEIITIRREPKGGWGVYSNANFVHWRATKRRARKAALKYLYRTENPDIEQVRAK